jgi:hypothetical protein
MILESSCRLDRYLAMANEIVPYQMSKALEEIHRLRALMEWRMTRDDIRVIHVPLKADIARLRVAVDALDRAFQTEKDNRMAPGRLARTRISFDQCRRARITRGGSPATIARSGGSPRRLESRSPLFEIGKAERQNRNSSIWTVSKRS